MVRLSVEPIEPNKCLLAFFIFVVVGIAGPKLVYYMTNYLQVR